MADNTLLNPGTGGDTVRDVAKTANSPAKTQVVLLDVGGGADASSEAILAIGQQTMASGIPVTIASNQSAFGVTGSGAFTIVGAAASGTAVSGFPVLIGGSDGTDARSLTTDNFGHLAVIGAAAQGVAVSGNPLLMGGSDGTNTQYVSITPKGTQGALGVAVQELKDSGRSYFTMNVNRVTAVATATLLSMTQNLAGTVTTSGTYQVSTGKTLRIQVINATVRGSSTAADVNGQIALVATSGVASTTSPVLALIDIPGTQDTSAAGAGFLQDISIPDGLEIPAGDQIALWQSCSTTSATVTVTLIGYQY